MPGRFSVEAAFKAVDQYSAVVAKISKSTDDMIGGLNKGVSKFNALNDRVLGGLKAVAGAVVGLGAVGGVALAKIGETGSDFEQAIANVGAVSLMTRAEVADLEKEARRLGSTVEGFGFTAKQTAEAMELMGKAGFTNAEIIQSIGGLLGAAAAEGMELSEAAGLVSNTLKGMGMAASETGRVADVLTLASARTNSSISSLGESMSILSSTARQFKIPFEQAVASVALLQDVGLDASTAGTAVSTMLTKIAAPTKKAREEMVALGLKFEDLHGNMLPLPEIFGQFEKASKKAGGNMKAVAFFSELVGLRGEKAALNMKDLFASGKFGELAKELEHASGSAEKMGKLRLDTLKGDLKLLSNAADDVQISLFDMESGPLRNVVKGTTKWIEANKGLVLAKVQDTIRQISENMPAIVTWSERIAIGVGVFLAMSLAVKAASVAIAAFELALGAASAAGSILAFTIGLVRAVVLSETVATVASTVATGASTAARWLWNAALAIGRLSTAEFTVATTASTVATAAGTAATWLRNAAQTAWNVAVGLGTDIATGFRAITSGVTIATVAQTAAIWLRNAAQTAYNVVVGLGATALGAFRSATLASTIATIAQSAAFAPLLLTLGALAAALGAVYLAWDQLNSLKKDTGGLGLTGTIGQMIEQGTWDPAKAVSNYENQQAQADAAQSDNSTPSVSSREDYASGAGGYGELTVRAEPGTKATVTKKPTGGYGISLPRSGEFAPAN